MYVSIILKQSIYKNIYFWFNKYGIEIIKKCCFIYLFYTRILRYYTFLNRLAKYDIML